MALPKQIWNEKPDVILSYLEDHMRQIDQYLNRQDLKGIVSKSLNYYYNRYWQGDTSSKGLGSAGELGELVTTSANHYGSLVRHVVGMITQEKLVFDVTTENSEISTREKALIAEAVLNTYFYERGYEKELYKAAELAATCGTSFVEVRWEPRCKLLGMDDGQPFYVGKPIIKAHDMFNVFVSNPLETSMEKQDYVIIRERVNRFDLAKQFPEKKEAVLNLPTVKTYDSLLEFNDEDLVWVYRCYVRESPSQPRGRYIVFGDGCELLKDYGDNPYVDDQRAVSPNGGLPVFPVRPSLHYTSFYGYTKAFDLIPLQENYNILLSTVATNQIAFGVQHIAIPKSASVNKANIGGGTVLYEYDVDENGKGVPEILRLLNTPSEIFSHMKNLVLEMETIMGINSIMRGKVETSIPPTGVAAALLTAQGQVANSDFERSYYETVSDVSRFLLYTIARFQRYEDIVRIVGKNSSRQVKAFSGEDVHGIENIKVSVGNPLAKTIAGRVAMLETLMSQGLIKTPEQAIEVLQTGNLKQELEHQTAELNLIRAENEMLLQGEEVVVMFTDNPLTHILEHKVVSDNPRARKDARVMESVTKHIEAHLDQLDILQESYPQLLALITGQPIPPVQPDPQSGVMAPGAQPAEAPKGLSDTDAAMLEQLLTSSNAAEASEGANAGAMSAMNAAENKLAKVMGEIPGSGQ